MERHQISAESSDESYFEQRFSDHLGPTESFTEDQDITRFSLFKHVCWALMSKEPFFASATARSTTDEAADADSDDSLTFVDTILAQRRLGVTLTALCW